MKKSRNVALLITGSVVLAACQRQAPCPPSPPQTQRGVSDDWTASPTPTVSPTPCRISSGRSFWHWFGGGGSGSGYRNNYRGSYRTAGGSTGSSAGDSAAGHASGTSRGGFGSHGGGGGGE